MTVFIIFWVAVALIFVLGFGFMCLKDYIEDNFVTPRKIDKANKRVLAKAKEISKTNEGIFLVEDIKGTYVCKGDYFYIGKLMMFPLYMKPNGTYTEEESEEYIYVGYCDGYILYRDRDKTGKVGNFDRLGNPIIVKPQVNYSSTASYISDDYYDTGSSGGYVADDSSSSHLRVDWRPDGSFGSIYEKNGHQYDEWGNEL